MPEQLKHWQYREIHFELLPALIESDKPATDEEAESSKRYWLSQGYTAMVESFWYLNRQKRRASR